MRTGSLTVVGSGIKAGVQTTPEAMRSIEQAEKVLYLFADPVPAAWVRASVPRGRARARPRGSGWWISGGIGGTGL